MSPLPDTDAANFIALEADAKWRALNKFRIPTFYNLSYVAYRKHLSDCLGIRAGVFDLQRPTFKTIARQIIADCKYKTELDIRSNLAVAAGTYALAHQESITGCKAPELAPRMIGGQHVECWNRVVLNVDSRPVIPFFDPRRSSSRLTPIGRRVALSLMHESIRAMDPDYANARLAIVQFDDAKRGTRSANITFDDGIELFSYAELDRMIIETYEMWNGISEGRRTDARRRGDDDADAADDPGLMRLWKKGA